MSAPSSIKLLKLSASNSHLSSGRLSTAAQSLTGRLRQEVGHAAANRATCLAAIGRDANPAGDQYTNQPADRQHRQNARLTGEAFASEQLAVASRARSSSAASSIDSLSADFASLSQQPPTASSDPRPTDARPRSATMGSSSSKCTKITDPPAACQANQTGWLGAHCHTGNLPPQLNQPFMHHACSVISLADCACCHSSFGHHDGEYRFSCSC